jgi:hypothetical protein
VTITFAHEIPVPISMDANGVKWRLRSLIAMGHDCTRMARAMGVPAATVRDVVSGKAATVTPAFRHSACRLWEAWWCYTPPVRNPAQRRAMTRARTLAALHDWPCPAALEEPDRETGDPGMDAPGYRPFAHYRPATGLGPAPDFGPAGEPQSARETAA